MVFPKKGHNNDKKVASNSSLASMNTDLANDGMVEMLIDVESPPCVLYGSVTESTGSLLSGLLKLRVRRPEDAISASEPLTPVSSHGRKKKTNTGFNSLSQTFSSLSLGNSSVGLAESPRPNKPPPFNVSKIIVKSVSLSLVQKIHYAKPYVAQVSAIQSCPDCYSKVTELARWDVVVKKTEIPIGDHVYPFSHLIPGSIPATVSLGSESKTEIKYELVAEASYKPMHKDETKGDPYSNVLLRLPVPVTRSILRGPDRNSLRIFPPTDLVATAVLPNIIYPKSTFPLELKLDGISSEGRRWRMRRLNWKIEEKGRVRLQACDVHKSKLKHFQKEVSEADARKKSSKSKPIKRSHDAAPQVTTSVCTLEEAFSIAQAPEDPNAAPAQPAEQDESNVSEENDLIHPSDYALRQERVAEQQRVRNEMLHQEMPQGTALFTEEVRTIAHGEIKSGWKSDFTGNGKVEVVTEINCMGLNSGVSNPINRASSTRPTFDSVKQPITVACDVEDPHLGIYVQHLLILEVIVAEEMLQYANGQPLHPEHNSSSNTITSSGIPDQRLAEVSPMLAARNSTPQNVAAEQQHSAEITPTLSQSSSKTSGSHRVVGVPTGAARVLRMQFRQNITERSGLGISWDDEVPPTYQDVRLLSPPSYAKATNKATTKFMQATLDGEDHMNETDIITPMIDTQMPLRPPQAHSHEGSGELLSPVQSPQLEHIISIQGSAALAHVLTPMNTQEVHLPSLSELMDTDRITQ
ncbi:LANO_0C02256g1_1 [Lachancea nothofagi CBS 11611]|uniref:LANO_0C02256g1_1 n=1 Tax=Lachancea nothofagi CBS 11611 TaxID=1266666 RepID=A0A1G4J4N4_9SACH|nr:LANO_0C02256g1_1 [Lachancea nothofagi CBS 11611]